MSSLSFEQCDVAMGMPLKLRESSAPGVDVHILTLATGQQYVFRWWHFASFPAAEFIELVDAVAVGDGDASYAAAEKIDIDVRLSAIVSVAKLPRAKTRRKSFAGGRSYRNGK
ncbi:MAG: hypothetical protein ACYC3X_29600 [Pirellulaceae bacterium]